ncbi:MAG: YibE/F family protein [Bacillota bacterium]|nr:YibE/F family protein [Bacillota bacterium]
MQKKQLLVLIILFFAVVFLTRPVLAVEEDYDYEGYMEEGYTEEEYIEEEHFYRARILKIDETEEQKQEYYTVVEQKVSVCLTSGPYRGEIITINNTYFAGDPVYDFMLEEGQEVIVVTLGEEGDFERAYVQDIARDRGVYYLIGVFILALLVVGRMKGLKTIITLAATIYLIIQFLLPLLLAGYSPILLAIGVATLAITFTLFIIGGLNLKSLVAILGTVVGVGIAGLMAYWAGSIACLTGFGTNEAQMLYFLDHTIDFRGLLFAGIIIGSLGAITDIGMSVSSAAAEIKQANPEISFPELFRAALNVGRDVMGTMANTLVLAYVGSAIPMLLLVMGYEIDWLKIINMDMIATEFVRGIAGSIGLVAAVPVTAILAGYFLSKRG